MGERYRGDDPAMGRRAGGTANQKFEEGLDADSVNAVVEHPRRRRVLDVVTDLGTATTRDLATQIAAREHGITPNEVTDEQRREVTISLYHVHVPKLADAGVLSVEDGLERVRPGPKAEGVTEVLVDLYGDLAPDDEQASPDA